MKYAVNKVAKNILMPSKIKNGIARLFEKPLLKYCDEKFTHKSGKIRWNLNEKIGELNNSYLVFGIPLEDFRISVGKSCIPYRYDICVDKNSQAPVFAYGIAIPGKRHRSDFITPGSCRRFSIQCYMVIGIKKGFEGKTVTGTYVRSVR